MAAPLGIQQLIAANEVSVKQKMTMRNKYVFQLNSGGELDAKERGSGLASMFSGSSRGFDIDVFDANKQAVVSLRRPFTFGQDKLVVSVGGVVASIVRREATFVKPVLAVNSPEDHPVLRIKGPFGTMGNCDFEVFDGTKRVVGVIRRGMTWNSVLTTTDSFLVRFPVDLDVGYKAALLGACLLIDFLFYE